MEDKVEIVEKRVKTTVIRRRKTAVPQEEPKVDEKPKEAKEEVVSKDIKYEDEPKGEIPTKEKTIESKEKKGVTEVSNVETKTEKKTDEKKKIIAISGIVDKELEEEEEEKKKLKGKKIIKKTDNVFGDLEELGRIKSLTQLNRIAHTDRVSRVFQPSRVGLRRKKVVSKKGLRKTEITVSRSIKRIVEMTSTITVGDLAQAIGVKAKEIIKKLMDTGVMVTVNQTIDFDTATLIAHDYNYEVKDISYSEDKILDNLNKGGKEKLESRPPIVTVMGHVDHGKTSLLDAIRSTNVTAGEAGGITQHIGAYTIPLSKGKITFLDTPGHAAFTSMRARGASVTDIVILVVAADDGIMPQTIESINHAKAAGVPIVVAINKIDKPEANLDRIKRQLSEHDLLIEAWGGQVLCYEVSAIQKKGIKELLEGVLLQAEVGEFKASPYVTAKGVVVEARLDRQKGSIATLLVQQGTIRLGDMIVAGCYSGRIRAMTDHQGKNVECALPSYAVQVLGLDGVPSASEYFHVLPDEQMANVIVENRRMKKKEGEMAKTVKISLEDFFSKAREADKKELNIILKTDVFGSLEAIKDAVTQLPNDKVQLKVIHGAVGGISESDVLLASASNAIIIGFNVRPETKALSVALKEGVDIKLYKIIYEMMEEIRLAMQGLLAPTKKEKYLGRAEVRDVFTVSKVGTIAGCYVIDGKILRTGHLRLLRDNVIQFEGKIGSLRRFKDDVKEAQQGFECGIGIEGYQDIKADDLIEVFQLEYIQTKLE